MDSGLQVSVAETVNLGLAMGMICLYCIMLFHHVLNLVSMLRKHVKLWLGCCLSPLYQLALYTWSFLKRRCCAELLVCEQGSNLFPTVHTTSGQTKYSLIDADFVAWNRLCMILMLTQVRASTLGVESCCEMFMRCLLESRCSGVGELECLL